MAKNQIDVGTFGVLRSAPFEYEFKHIFIVERITYRGNRHSLLLRFLGSKNTTSIRSRASFLRICRIIEPAPGVKALYGK